MTNSPPMSEDIRALIRIAVREDMGAEMRDRTVELAIRETLRTTGRIVARRPGTIAGTYLIAEILKEYAGDVVVRIVTTDGSRVVGNQTVAELSGSARAMLSAERVLLNFLGHMSGIATMTRRYVDKVAHLAKPPAICDTRKTTPGFRALDKYAVACGGGVNHRMGLYDGVMLKDNHLAAMRERLGRTLSLAVLTAKIRAELPADVTLWLEVDTLEQLRDALPGGGADIVLLDNMTAEQMREAVALRNTAATDGKPQLEASGGITLENVLEVAQTGIDRISIGALTHSAPVLDLSMEIS